MFLSLVLVCILSLFLGLVESARTAGARLYLEMAANSAMNSVMSQYNRNLWDMYHLLFLETESDEAVERSFASYLNFYLEQENLYTMKMKEVNVTGKQGMMDDSGKVLEQEILSYVTYRLPDIAADIIGITQVANETAKVGDFRDLLGVCRTVGKRTRTLEKCRYEIEKCLEDLGETKEALVEAVSVEEERRLRKQAEQFLDQVSEFADLVNRYEKEVHTTSDDLSEMKGRAAVGFHDESAGDNLEQEMIAYEQVIAVADEQLIRYKESESVLEESLDSVSRAVLALESAESEASEEGETEPDWSLISEHIDGVSVPGSAATGEIDHEKIRALDRLEEILQADLLNLVLDKETKVSEKSVQLTGIPSDQYLRNGGLNDGTRTTNIPEQFMINEYCFLSFDSFHERCERTLAPNQQTLQYEQEYLLCGKDSDRENLKETVEKLLMIRGAMNFMYLLQSSKHRAETEALVLAVSGGIVPVQFLLSFFILSLWAFGEAVWDVKLLMKGDSVPFVKSQSEWKLGLEELLNLQFLEQPETEENRGNSYKDYMRVLFLLMDPIKRNYRIMDVIQWNMQTVQNDFLVDDCFSRVDVQVTVTERHLFMTKSEYSRSVETTESY